MSESGQDDLMARLLTKISVWTLYLAALVDLLVVGSPTRKRRDSGQTEEEMLSQFVQSLDQATSEDWKSPFADTQNDETGQHRFTRGVNNSGTESGTAQSERSRRPFIDPSSFFLPRIFCTYDEKAAAAVKPSKFTMKQLNGKLCTDFIFYEDTLQEYHLSSVAWISVFSFGRDFLLPRFMALNDLKIPWPHLKTYLTISESEDVSFSSIILDEDRSEDFARSCVLNMRLWGFDGLIIKWLNPPEPWYLTQLLVDLRNHIELDFSTRPKGVPSIQLGVMLKGETGLVDTLYEIYVVSDLVDFLVMQAFSDQPLDFNVTNLVSSLFDPSPTHPSASNLTNTLITTTSITTSTTTFTSTSPDTSLNITSFPFANVTNKVIKRATSNNKTTTQPGAAAKIGSHSLNSDFIIAETFREWQNLGVDSSKIVVALTLTGQGYLLADSNHTDIGDPIMHVHYVHGSAKHIAKFETGNISFADMCNMTRSGAVTRVGNGDLTPYWHKDGIWVSYEDVESLRQKVEFLRDNHALGVMLFSQSEDDFDGSKCGMGVFPALATVHNASRTYLSNQLPRGQPRWKVYCGRATSTQLPQWWTLVLLQIVVVSFHWRLGFGDLLDATITRYFEVRTCDS